MEGSHFKFVQMSKVMVGRSSGPVNLQNCAETLSAGASSGRAVGKTYLGIISRLPVNWEKTRFRCCWVWANWLARVYEMTTCPITQLDISRTSSIAL